MTSAFGWCLSRVPPFLGTVAQHLGGIVPGENASIRLQQRSEANGITDVEVDDHGRLRWIFEAKAGFDLPSFAQLAKYAERLNAIPDMAAERKLIVLARGDRREVTLALRAPRVVSGVSVQVLSWAEVTACAAAAIQGADHQGKRLLRELCAYLEKVLGMQVVTSNVVYVVSLSRQTFGGGPTTFLEVVERHGQYFHPVGGGWPIDPPNYLAFRYDGRLQSIHHVDGYEVMTDYAQHFASTTEGEMPPHFLYRLGPPIRPSREVRTGTRIQRAARVYAHLDLLLTCDTISEAMEKTKAREAETVAPARSSDAHAMATERRAIQTAQD